MLTTWAEGICPLRRYLCRHLNAPVAGSSRPWHRHLHPHQPLEEVQTARKSILLPALLLHRMRMTTKAMHKAGAPTGKAYKQPEMGPVCKSCHLLPSGCSSKGCPLWSSAFRYPLGVRPCTTSCTCRVLPSTSSSSNTYTNAVATSCAPCSQKPVLQELQMSTIAASGILSHCHKLLSAGCGGYSFRGH